MTIEIINAILALDKDAQVVVRGTPSNESEYKDQVKIVSGSDENGSAIFSLVLPWTWEQVSAKQAELQAEYDATQYRRDRQARYNAELPMGDQFDAILKGFNQLRFDGQNLPADLDEVIGIWLGIKSAIPKE